MADIDVLNAEFQNLYRRAPTAAEESGLVALAQTPLTSFGSLANGTVSLVRQTVGVAEVGLLAYGFFTGVTLRASGLDYLLSPTGPNPDNLQSASTPATAPRTATSTSP